MLHYITQRLMKAFLIKKSYFAFCNFKSRYVYAEDINNMNRRVIGPVLAWFKGPFWRHFCITCRNKKSVQYQFLTSSSFKTFSLST